MEKNNGLVYAPYVEVITEPDLTFYNNPNITYYKPCEIPLPRYIISTLGNENLVGIKHFEDSKTIGTEDIAWMDADKYDKGYWYNKVTGKILDEKEILKNV